MASIHTCQCIAPLSCFFRTQPENLLPTFFPSCLMQLGKLLLSLPIGHAHLSSSPSRLSSHVILDCVKLRIIAHFHTRMRFLLFLDSVISILYRKGGWSRGNHDFFFFNNKKHAVTLDIYFALFLKLGFSVLTCHLLLAS